MAPNRPKGPYWVRYTPGEAKFWGQSWTIAEWTGSSWWIGTADEGDIYYDGDFAEIGPKIEPPSGD